MDPPAQIIEAPSPNFDERRLPITMLVLHYTGMQDGPSAIERLRSPEARVSAHYVVAEDGVLMLGAGETVIGQSDAFISDPDCRGLYVRSRKEPRPARAAAS